MTVKVMVLPRATVPDRPRGGGDSILADVGLPEPAEDGYFDFESAGFDEKEIEAPAAQLEVVDISEKEAEDLRRDPSKISAELMDLKLIEPVEMAEEAQLSDETVDLDGGGRATWGVDAVGATQSNWDGSGVKVAVLDTGIDKDHPAFDGMDIKHRNFTEEEMKDASGHGTHCAGTIFGRDVDGIRIGVAPGVTHALDAKVLPGTTDALVSALHWAFEDEGAQVISMSLNFDFYKMFRHQRDVKKLPEEDAFSKTSQIYRANMEFFDAILHGYRARAQLRQGAIFVAATGNQSKRYTKGYTIAATAPAGARNILAVGALGLGRDGLFAAGFSNTKPQVAAPGVNVLSARKGARTPGKLLKPSNGTSMACPHVAGLAALYWQAALADPFAIANPELITAMIVGRADRRKLIEASRSPIDVGNGLPVPPQVA